ncbi:MAG: DNA polymerase I [Synergistaceae bacterium]|nr:DNA polymerase I [Synergistaceae bacterium]
MEGKKLLLVDGHGLAFRAFYALPELTAPDGTPTNALVGFFNMLQKALEDWTPDMWAVIFDAPGPTFRHEAYPDYKAGRKPTPPELKVQVPIISELLGLMGVPVVTRPGVEADDVLASFGCSAAREGVETLILSSDKDILQILGPGVSVLRPGRGVSSFKLMDDQNFREEFGFPPSAMTDYLALLGDAADNVPGVPGVGDKTAKKLLADHGDLDGIYAGLDSLKPALRKKLEENREQAYRSKELVTLLCEEEENVNGLLPADGSREEFLSRCKALGLQKLAESMAPPEKGGDGRPRSRVGGGPMDYYVFLPEIEGKYPMGLTLKSFTLAGPSETRTGAAPAEALEALASRGGESVLFPDYKTAVACFGSGLIPAARVMDFKTAHYLLHPDGSGHDPREALSGYEGLSFGERARLISSGYRELAEKMGRYDRLGSLMKETDIPLIPVLVDMEKNGIGCDIASLQTLATDLSERLAGIEEEIAHKGGERINLNSPKQVAWLLFEKLGLPAGKKTKTGYSTDISVLEGLSAMGAPFDEVPSLLIEYRELAKMLSGFVHPLEKYAGEGSGIIHGVFEPAVTGTGRLSSRDPNLQNLPSYGEWSVRIKKCLHPAAPGNVFVSADYSQIELRVLAHLSGDERLLEAFAQGRDIHRETASWVFSTDPAMVTGELRRVAKMINFGLLYGMSSFGLAQRLGIGRAEASDIIERYFKALPGVKNYLEKSYEDAKRRGFAATLSGRIRPLDEVPVSPRDRDALRRVAVNTPIQGTAADIARKAMIDFAAAFPSSGRVRLALQVHDSLVCECPRGEEENVRRSLEKIMEGAAALATPLKVESKTGESLAEV